MYKDKESCRSTNIWEIYKSVLVHSVRGAKAKDSISYRPHWNQTNLYWYSRSHCVCHFAVNAAFKKIQTEDTSPLQIQAQGHRKLYCHQGHLGHFCAQNWMFIFFNDCRNLYGVYIVLFSPPQKETLTKQREIIFDLNCNFVLV